MMQNFLVRCLQERFISHVSSPSRLDLLQVSRGKNGRRNKSERDLQYLAAGSLAGQDSVQSASFYKKLISNHMLRKDNHSTERGSAMFFTMADSSFDETIDNNPVIFENGSKARLLMNIRGGQVL